MMNHVKSLQSLALIGTLTLLSTNGAWGGDAEITPLKPFTLTVDCAAGETIADAVAAVLPGQETRIVLVSDCTEDVTIRADGITVDGDPNGTGERGGSATLFGSIQFDDAHRVAVRNLTVTNPSGDGVFAMAGASFKVENSVITVNSSTGIVVIDGATGMISDSEISNNGLDGILIIDGAFVRIEFNHIVSNGGTGIVVESAVVRAKGNVITGNDAAAIVVLLNGTYRTGVANDGVANVREIIGAGASTGIALDIGRHSFADLRFVVETAHEEATYIFSVVRTRFKDNAIHSRDLP